VVHSRRHDVQSRLCRTGEHDFFDHLDAGDKVGFFERRRRPIQGRAAEEGGRLLGTYSGCATRVVIGGESGRDYSVPTAE